MAGNAQEPDVKNHVMNDTEGTQDNEGYLVPSFYAVADDREVAPSAHHHPANAERQPSSNSNVYEQINEQQQNRQNIYTNLAFGQHDKRAVSRRFLVGLVAFVVVLVLVIVIVLAVVLTSSSESTSEAKPIFASSCGALLNSSKSYNANSFYNIQNKCFSQKVYCDQTTHGGGWMRLHYKDGAETCHSTNTWTRDEIKCVLDPVHRFDMAVSDSLQTISGEQSWIFQDVEHFSEYRSCKGEADCDYDIKQLASEGYDYYEVLAHIMNCRTPTGSAWSQDYVGGYVSWEGTLNTTGSWSQAFIGCSQYGYVGDKVVTVTGGHEGHRGEFLHNACNDYKVDAKNSITSLWASDNTRVLWIRV